MSVGLPPGVPRPPLKPEPSDCCSGGCRPCIFDYYWDALDRWKARVEAQGADPEQVLAQMSQAAGPG